MKTYVESNPDTAKALQNFAKNPDAMRGWLQTQAGHMVSVGPGRTTSGYWRLLAIPGPWANDFHLPVLEPQNDEIQS